jgi:mannose-6-phosphate isomerase class I
LSVLVFEPLAEPLVTPHELTSGVWAYPTPGAPFTVRRLDVVDTAVVTAEGREILLCTDGNTLPLQHGRAAYLAAGDTEELAGPCTVWRIGPT